MHVVKLLILCSLYVLHFAGAQLLSCSDVGCPTDSLNGISTCHVEDGSIRAAGISNFTTSLMAEPWTWTVAYTSPDLLSANVERRFYLGYPPQLALQAESNFQGCALFFIGSEAALKIEAGTCSDVLGDNCLADLTRSATELVTAFQKNSSTRLNCSAIAESLSNAAPSSCPVAGQWGNITAKGIANQGKTSNSAYSY